MIEDLKNEPLWSSYLDPEDGITVLFYNRLTKESVSEKPVDYDGFYIVGEQLASHNKNASKQLYDKTFGDIGKMFTTPLELANVPLPTSVESNNLLPSVSVENETGNATEQPGFAGVGMWEEVKEEDQFDHINRAKDSSES